ncbi:uncharacterized protein FOMMEDRAFT_148381 [Fomitiporia mediterranea MF3/22]|uniref:uncharacterized protein n=1 Tax=Fomitiporia mediterranea (strain MF3/22) TaxID=694068 RepID=UPI00044076D6|nr:uncharacterized protein FOMMEDRAFT_148381 [Fomitiporia mediterranea MF3/22]EJC99997.1 hypothetical protein FOMMEDRAFT_148381 [Fomitiporia mediterranea MF3/22]
MMMATGYSTLFSLGLSNIHTSFPRDPDAPVSSSLSLSSTTPSTPSSSAPAAFAPVPPKIQIDTQVQANKPSMRRRRSSVTAAQSPLGTVGKAPGHAARASAVSPARTRHRRSESDAIARMRSNSLGDSLRPRRGAVRAPAPAPPDMPLPAVPALPAEYARGTGKNRASSPVRPPSDTVTYRRTCLSDKDCALNSGLGLGALGSFPVPPSAASTGSYLSSSQMLLTPGFASKLALALNTPPGSDYPSPNPLQSPVDPVLGGNSYFETRITTDQGTKGD